MYKSKYAIFVLLGAILYGTMSSFVKLSFSYGYTAAEISFAQAALAAIFLVLYSLITVKNILYKLKRANICALLFTGCLIGFTNYLYYKSVEYISASLSVVILMQFTWLSIIMEWLLFRKKPSAYELITVIVILVGTLFATDVFNSGHSTTLSRGLIYGAATAVIYAGYVVSNARWNRNLAWELKGSFIMLGSASAIFCVSGSTIISDSHFSFQFLLWAVFFAIVGSTIPTVTPPKNRTA